MLSLLSQREIALQVLVNAFLWSDAVFVRIIYRLNVSWQSTTTKKFFSVYAGYFFKFLGSNKQLKFQNSSYSFNNHFSEEKKVGEGSLEDREKKNGENRNTE